MGTDYEQVEQALTSLKSTVQWAINRDSQDIRLLKTMLKSNPLLEPMYLAVSLAEHGVISSTLAARDAAVTACSVGLSDTQHVVTDKEREASEWMTRAGQLAIHSRTAGGLKVRTDQWLGNAGDLYRDTAQVCEEGLREMRDQFQNTADFCNDIAQYHRSIYKLLSLGIRSYTTIIGAVGSVPFGQFFKRSLRAQQVLGILTDLGGKAARGELGKDGLTAMGSAARDRFYDRQYLEWDFRADPAMAAAPSSSTSG